MGEEERGGGKREERRREEEKKEARDRDREMEEEGEETEGERRMKGEVSKNISKVEKYENPFFREDSIEERERGEREMEERGRERREARGRGRGDVSTEKRTSLISNYFSEDPTISSDLSEKSDDTLMEESLFGIDERWDESDRNLKVKVRVREERDSADFPSTSRSSFPLDHPSSSSPSLVSSRIGSRSLNDGKEGVTTPLRSNLISPPSLKEREVEKDRERKEKRKERVERDKEKEREREGKFSRKRSKSILGRGEIKERRKGEVRDDMTVYGNILVRSDGQVDEESAFDWISNFLIDASHSQWKVLTYLSFSPLLSSFLHSFPHIFSLSFSCILSLPSPSLPYFALL